MGKKRMDRNKCCQECREIRTVMSCRRDPKRVQPLWQILKMLSIDLSYDPGIPLLDIYPREPITYGHTKFVHDCSWKNYS